jgi:thioredoxin 1
MGFFLFCVGAVVMLLSSGARGELGDVTDASFDSEVVRSQVPVLVFLEAAWCGPCRLMKKTLDGLSGEYEGRVRFVKMDVDRNEVTPAQLGILGLPTVVLFKSGDKDSSKVGPLFFFFLTCL